MSRDIRIRTLNKTSKTVSRVRKNVRNQFSRNRRIPFKKNHKNKGIMKMNKTADEKDKV